MMPAGKYYVGDLCYVMHPEWSEFCNLTINGDGILDGEFNLKDGRRFATYSTMYGDGTYYDDKGRDYGVDAGLIGCIRVEDISEEELKNIDDGHVVEFYQEFRTFSENGKIHIGHVIIETADTYEEEYDDYGEGEYDDAG